MAGLGEVCTHVAALLFYLEALYRMEEVQTCTQQQCGWIIPSASTAVEYLEIRDIDFTSARGKKRKLDETLEGSETNSDRPVSKSGTLPTDTEMEHFFNNLSLCDTKPAILSLVPPHSDRYIPKASLSNFPKPLPSLRTSDSCKLNYPDLLNACEKVSIEITDDMSQAVEKETRKQSKTPLWFKYRAGRVTASRMKAVCHTDVTNPAQSLVKTICYPDAFSFTSKQTSWGCRHEKQARERYEKTVKSKHTNLHVAECGLFINPQWPYIGASPDGIIYCDCCPKGVLEIKCPYCHRDESISAAVAKDKNFCLIEVNGQISLDHDHAYYYQVQTQIFVCDVDYCDFCVCTFSGNEESTIHIERISRNNAFWKNECVPRAEAFFRTCLLPELLGSWYTRPLTTPNEITIDSSTLETHGHSSSQGHVDNSQYSSSVSDETRPPPSQTFCYCNGPEIGEMIGCDNLDCTIEWFHLKCLKIKADSVPKGKWYCPDCRILPRFSKSKGKRKSKK